MLTTRLRIGTVLLTSMALFSSSASAQEQTGRDPIGQTVTWCGSGWSMSATVEEVQQTPLSSGETYVLFVMSVTNNASSGRGSASAVSLAYAPGRRIPMTWERPYDVIRQRARAAGLAIAGDEIAPGDTVRELWQYAVLDTVQQLTLVPSLVPSVGMECR